jgi:nicotinamidase/pyrazinamidase
VLGLATDYCVKFTALDAAALGFKTTLIEDASLGVNLNPGDVQTAVNEMRQAGVTIKQAADFLN